MGLDRYAGADAGGASCFVRRFSAITFAIYGRVSEVLQGFPALRTGFPHFVELQVPRLFEYLYDVAGCSVYALFAFFSVISLQLLLDRAVYALPGRQRRTKNRTANRGLLYLVILLLVFSIVAVS